MDRPTELHATSPDSDTEASSLCADCGLCCNGVMFHSVKLQSTDSPKKLAALGLKLKRKKKLYSILQPCPAHKDCRCSIYEERPERCRVFVCRQLLRWQSGMITAKMARETIHQTHTLIAQVRELFSRLGSSQAKKSLIAGYEAILEQPVDARQEPELYQLRQSLITIFAQLEARLNQDFRITPVLPPVELDPLPAQPTCPDEATE